MNMKKSIAGVMAGAMAVSAMATTASAWTGGTADQEQIAISYDLKKYVEKHTDTVVTITNKFDSTSGYDITAVDNADTKGTVTFGYDIKDVWCATGSEIVSAQITGTGFTQADGKTYTFDKLYYSKDALGALGVDSSDYVAVENVNGASRTDDKSAINVTFTTLADATANSLEGAFLVDNYASEASMYKIAFNNIEYKKDHVSYYATKEQANLDLSNTATKNAIDNYFTINYKDTIASVEYVNLADGVSGYVVVVGSNALVLDDDSTYAYWDGTYSEWREVKGVKQVTNNWGYLGTNGDYKHAVTTDVTDADGTVISSKTDDVNWGLNEATIYTDVTLDKAKAKAQAAADKFNNAQNANKELKLPYAVVGESGEGYAFSSYTVTCTYNVHVNGWDDAGNYKNGSTVVNKSTGIEGLNAGNPSIKAVVGSCYYDVYPMKSTLSTPADVISALKDDKEWGNHYTAPLAVLNDIVANNENVQLTFTTFSGKVDKDGKVTTSDSDKVWENAYFDQHLYQDGTYGNFFYNYTGPNGQQTAYDNFGSYSSAWAKNLFVSGLVVNKDWTMQLNDTDAFEWGDNTITFFWDSIKDSKVTNATQFIQSMLLYTPVDWYWDKLDVLVGSAMTEGVAAGEGAEDDGEEITEETSADVTPDEEPADEDVDEEPVDEEPEEPVDEDVEEDVEEDPVDEEPVDEEPVEEETTVVEETKTEESPKTGNAPIALAVIPVALAAAAVVAKKRG